MIDMTLGVLLTIIIVSLIKLVPTCLPTGTVEWLLSKCAIHSKLNDNQVSITFNGKELEGEDKAQIIHFYNQAIFMEKYYIWPGTEQMYLKPENGGTPIIIELKRGNKNVKLLVFIYNNRVDVVKQYNKKIVAYCLHSDSLQKHPMPALGNI
jgi:hypothetical protein